jgi:hypothetical protein
MHIYQDVFVLRILLISRFADKYFPPAAQFVSDASGMVVESTPPAKLQNAELGEMNHPLSGIEVRA